MNNGTIPWLRVGNCLYVDIEGQPLFSKVETPCAASGCDRGVRKLGLCELHYMREYRKEHSSGRPPGRPRKDRIAS